MKQKYVINVADLELNIVSDASPEEVDALVGMVDQRMREINLKSPRCTRNEAAILCALAYCSEKNTMQDTYKRMEKDAYRLTGENAKLKKDLENLQEELATLRRDSDIMRSILDRATLTATNPTAAKEAKQKYVPVPFGKKAEESAKEEKAENQQISAFEETPAEAPATEKPSPVEEMPVEEKPTEETPAGEEAPSDDKSFKSRVGNMFDFLTFSDI